MESRIPLNTASLQKAFPRIYQEIFSQCPTVISSSGAFWIAGEYAVLYGGLGLLQKVPARLYVGIKTAKDGSVKDDGGYFFDIQQQKFMPINLSDSYIRTGETLSSFIRKYLEQHLGDGSKGISFRYVIEAPIASGYNMSSAFAVSIATAILIYSKQISPEIIKDFSQKPASELAQNTSFNTLFRLATKIGALLHGGASAGSSVFASSIASHYPIIFFTEKREGHNAPSLGVRLPAYSTTLGHYDSLAFHGLTMDELGDISGEWPIDFGIIYSGDYMPASSAIQSVSEYEKDIREASTLAKEEIGKLADDFPSGFLARSLDTQDNVLKNYLRAINTASVAVFGHLVNLLRNGVSPSSFTAFANSLTSHHHALAALNISSERLDYLCNSITYEAGILNELIGCKLSGAGKKGSIFFATEYHGLRESLESILAKQRQATREEGVSLHYSSWRDGIGGEGVAVEQCLDYNIYSDNISKGAIKIHHLDKKGSVTTHICSQEEYESIRKKADFILDACENAIYVKGHKATSKDIYTTRETIAIIHTLAHQVGRWVSHENFHPSSYSADRGEFQSKIISPLSKTCEKYGNKKLKLKLNGSTVDFSARLEPGTELYIIEEIW